MKEPVVVVVVDNEDVEVYRTAEEAALDLEAIDVLNGEYVVFDCQDAVLDAVAASRDSAVEIRASTSASRAPERLRQALASFIRRVGSGRFGLSGEDLEQCTLAELVDAVQRFQGRRW